MDPVFRSMLCRNLLSYLCLVVAISALGQDTTLLQPAYFQDQIRPTLSQYCFQCHSSEKHKGDLDLERFVTIKDVQHHSKIWQDVSDKLANDEMPPAEKP